MKKVFDIILLPAAIAVILLITAGIIACEEGKDKMIDVPLEYMKCPCDHDTMTVTYNLERKNILMIDISGITEDKIEDKIKKLDISEQSYVFYNPATGSATFRCTPDPVWRIIRIICNFPIQFNWKIPVDGIRISFIYDEFQECRPTTFIPEHINFNIVLTSLKIHDE